MEKLVSTGTLTPQGRDFLIASLDPMHDKPLAELAGWPDVSSAASLVVCVKQSQQVSIPSGETGQWSCVVSSMPVLNSRAIQGWSRKEDLFTAANNTLQANQLAAVCINSYTGAFVNNFGTSGLTSNQQTIALPDAYCKGKGRLIGQGIEVTNTTSDLYKQGTVTVYRQPQQDMSPITRRMVCGEDELTTQCAFSTQQVLWQPPNLSAAMLLAGSRQWQAAEGSYMVVGFNDAENPALPAEYRQPVVYPANFDDLTQTYNDRVTLVPSPTDWSTGKSAYWPPNRWAPVHSSGSIFTGLSEQTTLTVTCNMYYELLPTAAEPEYAVLATPGASYDPFALELLTRAMEGMPVAVKAKDNGLGDWFQGVVGEVLRSPLTGAFLNGILPGSGIAANAIGGFIPAPAARATLRRPVKAPPKKKPEQTKKKTRVRM